MKAGLDIAYISNVGAHSLKPLFIAGCVLTSITLDASLVADRWLRHKGRLVRNVSSGEKILKALTIVFALVGTTGLILLSIFDTARHKMLHDIFLTMFMAGYLFSAVFICWEYQRLGISEFFLLSVSSPRGHPETLTNVNSQNTANIPSFVNPSGSSSSSSSSGLPSPLSLGSPRARGTTTLRPSSSGSLPSFSPSSYSPFTSISGPLFTLARKTPGTGIRLVDLDSHHGRWRRRVMRRYKDLFFLSLR